jgi:hypothetical protein
LRHDRGVGRVFAEGSVAAVFKTTTILGPELRLCGNGMTLPRAFSAAAHRQADQVAVMGHDGIRQGSNNALYQFRDWR